MTPNPEHTQTPHLSQTEFQEMVREQMRAAVRLTLSTILEEELTVLVGAANYERNEQRRDYRNGSYRRDLLTTVGLIEELEVPRARQGFQTQLFERYQRRRGELDQAMVDMFVFGASTQRVGEVVEQLTGSQPSASTVSRVYRTLRDEYETWKQRPLASHYLYAFADGTYFTVIYEKEGIKTPILAVVGINLAGEREVLGFTVGDRENQQAWADLLAQLKQRGLQTVDLWVTDGNQATMGAIEQKFPTAARQRCVAHKLKNVLGYIPKQHHVQIEPELKAIFYQQNRTQAEQALAAFCAHYEKSYPTAIACLRRDGDACFTFYDFPKQHWKTIRTNNVCERLFEEIKKRSHKMSAPFRNEDSCLLLFFAVMRTLRFRRIPVTQPATAMS
ncbi:MAG: IS256 family transposase [Candidatus Binatia bacterium]